MYTLINKNYMALSREMEFQADEIAAQLTGIEPLKSSLFRSGLSSDSYDKLIDFYNQKLNENLISNNLFREHTYVIEYIARREGIPMRHHLPDVSSREAGSFEKSKLVIKNQWASHPSTDERIAALERLNIKKSNPNHDLARTLFSQVEKLEEQLTRRLFSHIPFEQPPKKMEILEFQEAFQTFYESQRYYIEFKDYYDFNNPIAFMEHLEVSEVNDFESLFAEDKIALVKAYQIERNDLSLLESIQNKSIVVSTFDYDGIKYKAKEAVYIIDSLKQSLADKKKLIDYHDRAIYQYFYRKAEEQNKLQDYKEKCEKFIHFDKVFDSNFTLYQDITQAVHFMHLQLQSNEIINKLATFRAVETRLKAALQKLMTYEECKKDLITENYAKIDRFAHDDLQYFTGNQYIDDETILLFDVIHLFQYLNQRMLFLIKKEWLLTMKNLEFN